ncbi:MAG: efflux RND transporter permease subunit [SAR324 cluster bacterium]|nr:efflux RND transporter permease subunit [SAR324 cluster bacterium]
MQEASKYECFVKGLEREAHRLFPDSANIAVTGSIKLFTQTIQLMMQSMGRSYIIAGAVITLLMILILGSWRIGLISMLPNLAPIVVTMGVMGWMDIKLDMSNMLLGTVAIGLAVDDTIHFFHDFRTYYARSQNVGEAVRQTMLNAGRAILFTTLVLVTGFWLFMFASLNNLIQFGFLIGLCLIIALLADILLAPAMMELITRTERGRGIMARWGKADISASGQQELNHVKGVP